MNSIFHSRPHLFLFSWFLIFCLTQPDALAQKRKKPNPAKSLGASSPGNVPFWLDAEEYTGHGEQLADLKGHVKIIRGLEQLTCDHAQVNLATKDVMAEGHVLYITPVNFIRAEKMTYNFDTEKGVLHNALVQTGQTTFEGTTLYKTGESDFIAEDGTYTACSSCPPSWKFSSSHMKATVGSYAYLRNVTMRLYGFPFFWLPYLILPIKAQRQSGLLAPRLGIEDQGYVHYQQAFFWAIDQSHDLTFTGHSYANRGLKGETEYRYILSDTSKGLLHFSYMKDRQFAQSTRIPQQAQESAIPRWALHYDQHYELPGKYSNNITINTVRDLQYPVDFYQEIEGKGDPALESRVSFTKNTEGTHSSLETVFYQNLLRADPFASNELTVQKVPEFRYSFLEHSIPGTGALFTTDVNYINFSRPAAAFDDINGNNMYDRDPNPALRDLARTGQRLSVQPRILYPIQVGRYLDLLPSVTFNETFYQYGYGDKTQTTRQYIRADIAARTRFARVYGDLDNPSSNRYKHEIQPEISYAVVPYLYRENHLFFGPLDTEPTYLSRQPVNESDQIQFDYYDRLVDRHIVTYGVTNKIIRKRMVGTRADYREIIRHSLTQSYDIYDAYRTQNLNAKVQPFSEITSLLDVKLEYFTVNSEVNYYPYENISANSTRLVVSDSRGDSFRVGYLNTFFIPKSPDASVTSQSETLSLGVTYSSKYFNLSADAQSSLHPNTLQQIDSTVLLKPPGNCIGVLFVYSVLIGTKEKRAMVEFPINFGDGKSTPTRGLSF